MRIRGLLFCAIFFTVTAHAQQPLSRDEAFSNLRGVSAPAFPYTYKLFSRVFKTAQRNFSTRPRVISSAQSNSF